MTRLQHFLHSWGIHHCTTQEERDRNSVVNVIVLYFLVVVLAIDVFSLVLFFGTVYPLDRDYYQAYILPYFLVQGGITVHLAGLFYLRKFWRHQTSWFLTVHYGALLYVAAFALIIGPRSHIQYFCVQLLPLPFAYFSWVRRRELVWMATVSAVTVVTIMITVHYVGPFFPMPSAAENQVRILNWVVVFITALIVTTYFWYQTSKAEAEIRRKDAELQQELDFARDIQKGILPSIRPWNNVHVEATYLPLGKVSGDYFDIFESKEALYVLIADISGHGVPAAFVTMLAKQTFSSLIHEDMGPAEIMYRANLDFVKKLETPEYLTAFFLRIDSDMRMSYCCGGHIPPLYFDTKKNTFDRLDTDGFVLGAMPRDRKHFQECEIRLQPGDRLYLYTDGITEQRNPNREHFGRPRFETLLKNGLPLPMATTHKAMQEQLDTFRGRRAMEDDITFLTVEITN